MSVATGAAAEGQQDSSGRFERQLMLAWPVIVSFEVPADTDPHPSGASAE